MSSEVPKRAVIIFFAVVLSVYGLINFYIFIRGWEAIPHDAAVLREGYVLLFLVLSLSYLVGRFLERASLSWITSALVWLGAFWLAAMVYFLLIISAIDILRLLNHAIPFFPSFVTSDYERAKFIAALTVTGSVVVVVVGGAINARNPGIRTLDLSIPGNDRTGKTMSIVAVSDIHLGTIVCRTRLERIVEKINALNPDLVLLPGDVVDEDVGPVIRQNLGETLRKIRARFGVIAITGNHEYIGGVEEACDYLMAHGVTVLRDSSIQLDNGVSIVGREDRSFNRAGGRRRKSLKDLMAGIDKNFPVIVMDHQPFHLEEAEENGVDLQLSGHTHHGQLWPFNYITQKVYELSWGYKKRGKTHIYVSCGVGTWGPPVRTGNRPEIVHVRLSFA